METNKKVFKMFASNLKMFESTQGHSIRFSHFIL